ncbi:hypothetical protein [Bradyrhizobium macuxiense]|uniref:hypothetical protein n=1 Tax=Bradyrhizobium macuxiense TaxID=1755647 RepID=UPI001919A8A1|nr:hypothetical protein [Bradyrhizobium macuxiense]
MSVAIVLADKADFLSGSQSHKALVGDHDALEAQKLLLIERCATSIANRTTPPLNAILGRPFALDHVAGLRGTPPSAQADPWGLR